LAGLGSDSTIGTVVYVDSAGQVRAAPSTSSSVAWTDITGKPDTFPSSWDTMLGKPTSFPTTWTDVAGKPSTFTPTIGTTAVTAKAGNWLPTWNEVSGKPNFASYAIQGAPVGSTGYAVMTVSPNNQIGMYWSAGPQQPVVRIDGTDFNMVTQTGLNVAVGGLQDQLAGKANAYSQIDATRYTYGPSAGTYGRNVTGSGFYAVWMDAGLEFGRNVSARKYKENIATYAVPPGDVLALQPVKYTLISSPDMGEQYGLIADDVAATLPEIVVFEDGEPETIRYDLLAVALLEVVKDQERRIAALEGAGGGAR
jgi:hypothetical protein